MGYKILRPWLQYVQGTLPADRRAEIEDELQRVAPTPVEFVALLTRLRTLAKQDDERPPSDVVARAVGIFATLARPHSTTFLGLVPAPAAAGARKTVGPSGDLRTYVGGRFRLDVLVSEQSKVWLLTGQLWRDDSAAGLDGVTIYIASEDEKALASVRLNRFGEFVVEVPRSERTVYVAMPGEWLVVPLGARS